MRLHPKKGVNPHLAFCPNCGKENGELILIGSHDKKYICRACGTRNYGSSTCLACKSTNTEFEGEVQESEQIPGSLCAECKREAEQQAEIVAAGGVYFRCADCKRSGVIKPTPYADEVRRIHNIPAPKPCGVEFTKADCPVCGEQQS